MIDKSNKSKGVDGSQFVTGNAQSPYSNGSHPIVGSVNTLVSYAAAILQVLTGLALIAISILGMITPVWFSAILSIVGSVSCMSGVFLLYLTSANKGNFESLTNEAIRRVINSQN